MLEFDPWTQTPISANIGTFAVPLLMLLLTETHLKGVPHTISEKDGMLRLGDIKNCITVEYILVPQNASKLGFFEKKNMCLYVKEARILLMF